MHKNLFSSRPVVNSGCFQLYSTSTEYHSSDKHFILIFPRLRKVSLGREHAQDTCSAKPHESGAPSEWDAQQVRWQLIGSQVSEVSGKWVPGEWSARQAECQVNGVPGKLDARWVGYQVSFMPGEWSARWVGCQVSWVPAELDARQVGAWWVEYQASFFILIQWQYPVFNMPLLTPSLSGRISLDHVKHETGSSVRNRFKHMRTSLSNSLRLRAETSVVHLVVLLVHFVLIR